MSIISPKIKDKREREKTKTKETKGYTSYSEAIDESYIIFLWV